MLQEMREKTQGIVAKAVIGFIVFMFAVWGVETLISGSNVVEVAKVNGEKITEPELQHAIEMQKRQMLAMMGDNVQPNMLDENTLRGPALDSLINQRLLLQGASDLKLGVPNRAVDQTILSMQAFQENGKFSADRYQMLLRNQGYTPSNFKQLLHQDLVLNQLQSGFIESDFITSAELDGVAKLLQQQRSFRYLTIPIAALAEKTQISDADVDAYYKEHQDQFLREEQVKLDYVELRASDYYKAVDDAAVRAEYDRAMADFKPKQDRHAAHILIEVNAQRNEAQAKALAETVKQKLAAGEPFDKLAQQYSDDVGSKSSGGDLGYSSGDAFPPTFEQALAGLKVGDVSAPVRSESGFHLIKLLDEQTTAKPTFEEKKAEFTQRLQQSGAQPELLKTVEKLRDLVFNSESLQAPAEQLKLQVRQSDWIDRKNSDPLLGNPKVVAAAFSSEVLKDHNNSDVLELAPDHYIVLRVKEHVAPTPKPVDEVKPVIVAKLKQERANEEGKKAAEQLIAQARQGEDLQKLASAQGYAAQSVEKSQRNNGAVNQEVLRAAFAMPRPAAGQAALDTVSLNNGDVAVVQLQAVEEGAPDSLNPAQRNALTAQLRQGMGTAAFTAYMENVKARAKIKRQ